MRKLLITIFMYIGCSLFLLPPVLPYHPAIAQSQSATGVVLQNANLRAGPGTTYAIVGKVNKGQSIKVVASNSTGDWYQIEGGKWIAAFLVQLSPALPVVGGVADAATTSTQPITVVGWNTQLNDADVNVIAQRIADFQDVDLWGLAEINNPSAGQPLENGAEVGENADYASILGVSGGGDRLLAIYDTTRFRLIDSWEIDEINTTGNARAPLVLHLVEKSTGLDFLFMVNHLYRTRDEERFRQAELLNRWASQQTLPVIAVGDYNFDWDVNNGTHDKGYDLLTQGKLFDWVRPATLITTQCSGSPCSFNSVLDFVFTAGSAESWRATSQIMTIAGDFPDDNTTSDHRPVLAQFWTLETATAAIPTPQPRMADPTATPFVPTPTLAPVQAPQAIAPMPVSPSDSGLIISEVNKRGEYVVIRNDGVDAVNLNGWTLQSVRGDQRCALGGDIAPGATLTIFAMTGNGGFNCGFGSEIWNNKKDDDAVLIDPNGTAIFVFDS